MTKSFIHCSCRIIFSPRFGASLCWWQTCLIIELCFIHDHWNREGIINFSRNCPQRNTIPTEFLTEEVLMELHKCIDVITACQIDEVDHPLNVFLVKLIFSGFNTCPHHTESQPIDPSFLKFLKVSFIEVLVIIGRRFSD